MKKIIIRFKNKEDFRNRIARLWQEQKDDEMYNFQFADKETEEDFERLIKSLSTEGQQGASDEIGRVAI